MKGSQVMEGLWWQDHPATDIVCSKDVSLEQREIGVDMPRWFTIHEEIWQTWFLEFYYWLVWEGDQTLSEKPHPEVFFLHIPALLLCFYHPHLSYIKIYSTERTALTTFVRPLTHEVHCWNTMQENRKISPIRPAKSRRKIEKDLLVLLSTIYIYF